MSIFKKKSKKKKRFLIEFKSGTQMIIKADTRREARDEGIEFTWDLGDVLSVEEIIN